MNPLSPSSFFPASPVAAAVDTCVAGLYPQADASRMAACVFDLRRSLTEQLLREADSAPVRNGRAGEFGEAEDLPAGLDSAQEDILRDSLPPLLVPPGPYTTDFSAWRGAIVAVLGLVFGSALSQGLGLTGAGAVLCSTVGVGAALWLAEILAQVRVQGELRLGSRQSGKGGLLLRWKSLRRWGRVLWGAALVLTLLRDFLQQNPALQDILSALTAFLVQGSALPMLQNLYWLLTLLLLFALLCQRPKSLDIAEYRLRLYCAAQAWWDGALLAREGILARYESLHGKHNQTRQKAAQELCSFAAELPSAQAFWLRERLHMLGFSTNSPANPGSSGGPERGQLVWHPGLASHYDVVGHVEAGDSCYVDTPPLTDDKGEQLLRKGTLRKVRV